MAISGGCVRSFGECHCECHSNPSMRHMMACCEGECPHCGKRIVTGAWEQHVKTCQAPDYGRPGDTEPDDDAAIE